MKKNKINALLAAGCVALLTPGMANATDLGNITNDTESPINTSTGGDTFNTINIDGTKTLQINSTNGALTKNEESAGQVTLGGTAQIQLAPAIADITFNSVTANGTDNKIIQQAGSTPSSGTTTLGGTAVTYGSQLTLSNTSGGTLAAGDTTLGTAKASAPESTGGATLKIEGDNVVTVGAVSVTGTNNTITNSNSSSTITGITMNANSGVALTGVNTNLTSNETSAVSLNGANNITTKVAFKEVIATGAGSEDAQLAKFTVDSTDAAISSETADTMKVDLRGNTKLTTTGANTIGLKNVVLSNDNNALNLSNGTTIDKITLNTGGGVTFANGISTSQVTSIAYNGTNVINVNDTSTLNGLSLTNTAATTDPVAAANIHTVTYNNDGKGVLTTGNIALNGTATTDPATLRLYANNDNGSNGITVGNNNTTSLQGNTMLTLGGANNITLNNVNVSGTSNAINNNDAGERTIGAINLNDTDNTHTTALSLSGVNSSTSNVTFKATGTNPGANTLSLANSTVGNLTFDGATNATIENTNATTGSTFGTATVGNAQTLVLSNAVASTLTGTSVDLNTGTLNLTGSGTITTGVKATGTGNDITNTGERTIGTLSFATSGTNGVTVTGTNALTFTGVSTGTDASNTADINTISNNGANNYGNLTVNANDSLSLTTNDTSAATFTNAAVNAGASSESPTTLTLNANNGTISGTSVALNGNAKLGLSGAQNIIISDNVTASGQNNTIENTDATRSINKLSFATSGTNDVAVIGTDKVVTFSNGVATGTDAGNTADTDTINNYGNNDYKDITVNTNDTLTLKTADTSAATFEDATATTSTLNLNANSGDISGTSISLSNSTLNLSGSEKITLTGNQEGEDQIGVTVSGTNNHINNTGSAAERTKETTNRNLQVIKVADDSTLNISDLLEGIDFTKFNLGNNAKVISGGDSDLGHITVADGATNNVTSTGTTTYDSATLGTNSTLELVTTKSDTIVTSIIPNTATSTGIVSLSDGSTVSVSETGTGANSGTVSLGHIQFSANNAKATITDNSAGTVSAIDVTYQDGAELTVNTTNQNTTTTGLGDITQNGTNVLNAAKSTSIGTLTTSGIATKTFTINATDGDTTINNIAESTAEGNHFTNVVINATDGNVTLANSLDLGIGDTFRTSGTLTSANAGTVTLNGVNVTGGKLQVSNTTELNGLTVTNKLDNSGDMVLNSTTCAVAGTTNANVNGTLNVVTTDSVPYWDLDIAAAKDSTTGNITVSTDTLTGITEVQENGTQVTSDAQLLDLNVTSLADNFSSSNYPLFVKYVKLADAPTGEDGTEINILKSIYTVDTEGTYKWNKYVADQADTTVYYSYINPSDTTAQELVPAYGSYDNNTIRITNYNIASDDLVNFLTQQGTRSWSNTGGMQHVKQEGAELSATSLIALPNMQARANTDNIFNITSVYAITGYVKDPYDPTNAEDLKNPDTKAQLFTLNSTDGIDRTLNLSGIVYRDGYSYDKYSTNQSRQDNTGLGAALHVESADDTVANGKSTVNLGNFTGYKTITDYVWNETTQKWEAKTSVDPNFTQNPEFVNNIAKQLSTDTATTVADATTGFGGAVYSTGVKSTITAANDVPVTFTSNKADRRGGALYNSNGSTVALTGNNTFTRNVVGTYTDDGSGTATWTAGEGGAIYNTNANLTLGNQNATLTFSKNEALGTDGTDGHGGAIASVSNSANFYGKLVADGNAASGNGGFYSATDSTVNIEGSQKITNNTATGKGGAIYANNSVINITANSGNTEFTGNKSGVTYSTTAGEGQTIDADCGHALDANGYHVTTGGDSNAIYLDNATLNLNTSNNNKITFNDKIANNGEETTKSNIVQNGNVYYNTDMSGYNGIYNLNSGNAYFQTDASVPFAGDYILGGGSTMWLNNGTASSINANSLNLANTTASNPANLVIDMNLNTLTSDRFELNGGSTTGFLNISDINKIGETTQDSHFFNIAEGANVETSVKTMKSEDPSYEYHLLGTSESGKLSGLLLQRVKTYNSSLLGPQVAANARLASQLDTYQQLLHRVDEIAENRYFYAKNKTNLYAADPDVLDDRKIDNGYTPYVNQQDGGNLWVKPDFTMETIHPEGLHGYSNRAYNTFVGYETPVANMKNGWDLINTVFGGYQGSYQSWDEAYNWQNGGSGGYMANLYHKNFFTGGVVMMGASAVNTHDDSIYNRSMNFGLFDIGGGIRVGYNVGMGKHWLFQPMLTTSYIYISGVDQHNERGERLHMKGTNTFQIAPGFKIIGNYGTWKPYLLCDYTWPIIAKSAATYNDINLPELGMRSYLEYGVGLRKDMGERFSGHLEAVMRNIGRTGVSFQGGLVFKF